jgi:hypothetical protein
MTEETQNVQKKKVYTKSKHNLKTNCIILQYKHLFFILVSLLGHDRDHSLVKRIFLRFLRRKEKSPLFGAEIAIESGQDVATFRHSPIREQWKQLCEKVRGHYGYYGITGNMLSMRRFLYQVHRSWQRWLNRRNSKRSFTWEKFELLLARYSLPIPKIVHSAFKRK